MAKINPNQPNPTGSIVSCQECGRDTKAKWAICNQCSMGEGIGGFQNNSRIHERKDRKQNPYYHTK